MIGLQWRPGKQGRKPQAPPVVISSGPSTPRVERSALRFDPLAAWFTEGPPVTPKRGPGRPKKVK